MQMKTKCQHKDKNKSRVYMKKNFIITLEMVQYDTLQ